MFANEHVPPPPGTAFALVRALLALNRHAAPGAPPAVEVVVMSRNSPETSVRVMNAVGHYGLAITRYAFTGGEPLASYVKPFGVDLFLSTNREDVQWAADTSACVSWKGERTCAPCSLCWDTARSQRPRSTPMSAGSGSAGSMRGTTPALSVPSREFLSNVLLKLPRGAASSDDCHKKRVTCETRHQQIIYFGREKRGLMDRVIIAL